jgi:L-amino acid N-acyltransferase YncA
MPIRHATASDLPEIVSIYNASIPGRMAVAERKQWFADFDAARRPLWVLCADDDPTPRGWLSLRSFYGRAAYEETVEVGVYTAPDAQRRGYGSALLNHALREAPALRIRTLLAFTFGHNVPSLRLFRSAGFGDWAMLPGVARLDGIRRDLVILGRAL